MLRLMVVLFGISINGVGFGAVIVFVGVVIVVVAVGACACSEIEDGGRIAI